MTLERKRRMSLFEVQLDAREHKRARIEDSREVERLQSLERLEKMERLYKEDLEV